MLCATSTVNFLVPASENSLRWMARLVSFISLIKNGRPDYPDLDSDNDGVTDLAEAGCVDANGDGQYDNTTIPPPADGWSDAVVTNWPIRTLSLTTKIVTPIKMVFLT